MILWLLCFAAMGPGVFTRPRLHSSGVTEISSGRELQIISSYWWQKVSFDTLGGEALLNSHSCLILFCCRHVLSLIIFHSFRLFYLWIMLRSPTRVFSLPIFGGSDGSSGFNILNSTKCPCCQGLKLLFFLCLHVASLHCFTTSSPSGEIVSFSYIIFGSGRWTASFFQIAGKSVCFWQISFCLPLSFVHAFHSGFNVPSFRISANQLRNCILLIWGLYQQSKIFTLALYLSVNGPNACCLIS